MHSKFPFKLITIGFLLWSLLVSIALNVGKQHHDENTRTDKTTTITVQTLKTPDSTENIPILTGQKTTQETAYQPQHTLITGTLKPGESLDASLKRLQLQAGLRSDVIKAFATCLNFKKLSPNDIYTVTIDEQGELVSCTYESSPLDIYKVIQSEDGFAAEKVPVSIENRTILITGKISTNLFAAFSKLEEQAKIVLAFADIFSSKIDFNTEPRTGDTFSLVVEKIYKNGKFIGYGKILHAKYDGFCGTYEGFNYGSDTVKTSHFDAQGQEIGTSFLRSPIPFGRVSSGFTWKRKHPILGTTRPHLGIDLAAPRGTPIMAAADGIIELARRNGGFGNQVIIKHTGGYKTHYGHLSKFGKGIRKGKRVQQKDIIGYVGSTGLSTGPHLDYRIQDQGTFKNPFSVKFKPKTVLTGDELQRFSVVRDSINQLLINQQPGATLLVKQITVETSKNFIL